MPSSQGVKNANLTIILLATAGFLLAACHTLPQTDQLRTDETLNAADALFGAKPVMPSPQEIHALDPQQQTHFLQYFHDPIRAAATPYQRVGDYLHAKLRNFSYRTDTLIAHDTFSSNSGNCLSLAILTTALAQLVDVHTAYQLMDAEPVFEFHGTLVEKGVHVRTLLLSPSETASTVGFMNSPGITVDFYATQRERFIRNMASEEYVAMYFRNMSSEALRNNDFKSAYWYARESLRYHANSADALNMLAVTSRRAGHPQVAESIYLYAIEHADEKLTLLKNYRLLLANSGRTEEAQLIDTRLRSMDDPSPSNWFTLARSAFEDGDYEHAIGYYRRALSLAPYLHEAHLGIAQSYAELGNRDESLRSLVAAVENAGRSRDRKYYKAKLQTFQN